MKWYVFFHRHTLSPSIGSKFIVAAGTLQQAIENYSTLPTKRKGYQFLPDINGETQLVNITEVTKKEACDLFIDGGMFLPDPGGFNVTDLELLRKHDFIVSDDQFLAVYHTVSFWVVGDMYFSIDKTNNDFQFYFNFTEVLDSLEGHRIGS